MKLLTKSEIDQQRAAERKLEIDEGMKLARRVDNLRRTAAEEEGKLTVFGEANKQIVLEQLSELVNDRDTLRIEVGDLEVQRAKALEPVDAEWEKVNARSAELDEQDVDLRYRARVMKDEEESLAIRRKDVADAESRIALDRKQTTRNLLDSDAMRTEVALAKVEFDTYQQKTVSSLEAREAKVRSDEENVVNRLERVQAREVEQDERERALNERERAVTDLEATTARNTKRHG